MSLAVPYSDASQPPKPPTEDELKTDSTTTFDWITDRLSELYASARSAPDGIPVISHRLHTDIYMGMYKFCGAANSFKGDSRVPGPHTGDLYHRLEQIVRDHCVKIRMQVFPLDLSKAETARAGIQMYLAHLRRFKDLANRVAHLARYLETDWIRREIEAGTKDLLFLRDIHRRSWREDMLQCGKESVGSMTGIDFLRHAGGMLLRPGEGWASDDDEGLLRSLAGPQAPRSTFRMRGNLMVVSEHD
ncbi:hypothetical protein KC349_g7941 [Hortaea werneckii]|nr:hypothetical protein KC349_g7941 [Hortaea werneckii]